MENINTIYIKLLLVFKIYFLLKFSHPLLTPPATHCESSEAIIN